MSDLLLILRKKEAELKEILEEARKDIMKGPKGTLRIVHKRGKVYYYHRINDIEDNEASPECGHFIRKENYNLIKPLAQKTYCEKIQRIASKQLEAIQKLIKVYEPDILGQIYKNLSEERKNLIVPIRLPDHLFVQEWKKNIGSKVNEYPIIGDNYSERGEHVRSKSEKILADKFDKLGIPYIYEKVLEFDDGKLIFPDFTLLNISSREEVYFEHFGMMDIPEYAENAVKKINQYQKNGYILGKNLLCSFETKNCQLNIRNVEKNLKEIFKL